jgi:hypothetical protein
MIDTNVKAIGSIRMCNGPTADPSVFNFYGEGFLGSTPFRGVGECYGGKRDFPERGIGTTSCFLHLSGLPSQYVGGLLTTNTMWSRKGRGIDTDPPGYTEASIATIRLWRKRDAPSSAIPLTKESLVGTWELVSFKETNEKGEVRDAYGPNPVGFLTYTADDRVSVIMADSRRKPLSIPPPFPIEERAEAFSTFAAYAGTYTLTGDKVIHHIEVAWAQNLVNTEQVRSVTLQGDRLTLRGGLAVKGVTYDAGSELVWERMKPQATGK